jgi:16S rRNA (cytidine1402-2'-O)-methyltransferase
MSKNKLYLIPTPIAESRVNNTIADIVAIAPKLRCFVVEHLKTARRFLKAIDRSVDIEGLSFFEINQCYSKSGLEKFLAENIILGDIGLMSEAGCPAIADPGHQAVAWCHHHGVSVIPMVGPNSILLTLMASGFNGQNFTFHGYLPNKKPDIFNSLKNIYQNVLKINQTQIFIETPYRNGFMIESICASLPDDARLCVALDLDGDDQLIINKKVKEWKVMDLQKLHKRPAVFALGKFE